MTNTNNADSSDDETESYYDSSDDDYLYIGDEIAEQTPYCASCNITIESDMSYLHCSNTNDYLCLHCFETAHVTPETADDYQPIWNQ